MKFNFLILIVFIMIFLSSGATAGWIEHNSTGGQDWSAVASSADGVKLAATTYGEYAWTSNNSGTTWVEHINQGFWSSIASSGDGMKLIMGAYGGNDFLISNDSGLNWFDQNGGMSYDWYDVDISTDGQKMVAFANEDNIFTSNDSGMTWVNTGQTSGTQGAMSGDGLTIGTVIWGSDFFISNDSGANWVNHSELGSQSWVGISISQNGSRIVLATNQGYVYISDNRGATWSNQSYISRPYDCPDFSNQMGCEANAGCVWLCDDFPTCKSHSCDGTMYYLNGLAMSKDGSTIGVWQAIGNVFISNDSGVSWVNQTEIGERDWSTMAFSEDGSRVAVAGFNDTPPGHIWTYEPDPVVCTPNWNCSSFGSCYMNMSSCLGVTDLNMCNESFAGNLSDYDEPCSCLPNWSCSGYGLCINNTQSCNSTIDMNICGNSYTGNYSEFTPLPCYNLNLTREFTLQCDPQPILKDRMECLVELGNNSDYRCWTLVSQVGVNGTNNEIYLQVNPSKTEYQGSILLLGQKAESREYFTISNGIGNVYYTNKNIAQGTTFIIQAKCVDSNGIITKSEVIVTPTYQEIISALGDRGVWLRKNIGAIFIYSLFILLLIGFVLFIIHKESGR